jgi:sensor histidine kinase YesM
MKGIRKYLGAIIQVAIWIVIFAMPFYSPRPGHSLNGGVDYTHFLPVLLSFMLVFYVNYFYLIKKFIFTKKFGWFAITNILLILISDLLVKGAYHLFFPMPTPHARPRPVIDAISFTARNFVIYLAIVGIAIAVKMTMEWYKNEAAKRKIEQGKAEAELQNLKSQINPHFLFNTLNNIYSLIQIDQGKAQEAVHELSGLMRYVLYDSSQDKVPLSKEITFLKDYIKLMSLRLSPNVKLTVYMPDSGSDRKIAPLLFIPLVENAFKHGVSDSEPSFIDISITEENEYVVCKIINSNFPKTDADRSGSGIGIGNLQKRLDMLYPGKYSFEHGVVQTTYQSVLKINTEG